MSTQAISTERSVDKARPGDEQILGKAYDMQLMLRLWRFVKPHWRLLLVAMLLIPVRIGFELLQPLLLKYAIENNIAVHQIDGLGLLALAYLAVVALHSFTSYAELYSLQLLGQRSMHDLRLATYRHVLSQRAAFFDRMPVGRLLTRMTNDVETINEMFASGVITLVADLVLLISIVVTMLLLDVKLTLMTFLTLPLLIWVINYARVLMRSSFREIRVKLAAMNSFAQEHLSGMKVVQLFARERQALQEYNEINAAHRDAYLDSIRADASMYALVEAIGTVCVAVIAWYASQYMAMDPAQLALVVAFIQYIYRFFLPVRDLSAKYTVMQSAMAASERIMALLDTHEPDAPVAAQAGKQTAPASGQEPEPAPGQDPATAISLRDVYFAYRTGEDVLRGVSFDIPRGTTVAVVGATGSGKSTIIKLLARLYDIDRGEIRVQGRNILELDAQKLRGQIAVVSQDVFLFSGTVADNVRLGNSAASDETVRDALRRVGADRMLMRRLERRERAADTQAGKPQTSTAQALSGNAREPASSADTADILGIQVAERGSNFSAGERQLISFARALVKDPDILVLDEATAHVDPEAEAWIEQGVAELMRDRTTLVIAHRLSTIRNADQIVVMSRGRVVERGTHEDLIQRGGVYARLERTFSRKD